MPTNPPADAIRHAAEKANRKASLVLTAKHIPQHLLRIEAELIGHKWPEYCFISPWDATLLYAEAYRNHFRFNFGIAVAFEIEPEEPSFQILWQMRQAADRWGMPYGDLLTIAFSMNRRNPAPFSVPHSRFSQLHNNRNFTKKFRKRQHELSNRYLSEEAGPQFYIEAFTGLPSQIAFRKAVIAIAENTGNWRALLRNRVVGQTCIPVSMLKGRDLSSAIEAIKSESSSGILKGKPYPGLVPHQLWQSCYGVPGARDPALQACANCPASTNCLAAGQIIERAVAAPGGGLKH